MDTSPKKSFTPFLDIKGQEVNIGDSVVMLVKRLAFRSDPVHWEALYSGEHSCLVVNKSFTEISPISWISFLKIPDTMKDDPVKVRAFCTLAGYNETTIEVEPND